MVRINGVEKDVHAGSNLKDILEQAGYKLDVIAVQLNGSIITKEHYPTQSLSDGDVIEVVAFVGGGC